MKNINISKIISPIIAIILIVGFVLWYQNAQIISQPNLDNQTVVNNKKSDYDTAENNDSTKPFKVNYISAILDTYPRHHVVSAQTQALRKITLRSHTDGEIVKRFGEEGNNIKKNTIIAYIDIDDRLFQMERINAQIKYLEEREHSAEKLSKKGYQRSLDLSKIQAELATMQQQKQSLKLEIEKLNIKIPFTGIIENHHIEVGDYVRVGDPISTIISLDPLEISFPINESIINDITIGDSVTVTTNDNKNHNAKINFISTMANTDTRSFEVRALLPNSSLYYRVGQSVKVDILYKKEPAFYIPAAALSLNDNGVLGVKLVGDDNIALFQPVNFLGDKDDGVYITGINEGDKLVTVGQGFIKAGALLDPMKDDM